MTTTERTLLIDGDAIAFRAAAAAQEELHHHMGWVMPLANSTIGEAIVENMLANLRSGLKADHSKVYITRGTNWRTKVDPEYKAQRDKSILARPILLGYLKDYLIERHGATFKDGLEADDLLALEATKPHTGQYVVVGRDKDFKTIPGYQHQLDDMGHLGGFEGGWGQVIRCVSDVEADRFHMFQTLAGDQVDNVKGCPSVGAVKALSIVTPTDGLYSKLVPVEAVKTRGINKGEASVKWVEQPTDDLWEAVVSHFEKAGLSEHDATREARLTRLLRHGEYNWSTGEVDLWEPTKMHSALRGRNAKATSGTATSPSA